MIVRISDAASADLEGIADYIAIDSPYRADSFVQEILIHAQGLSQNPKRYALLRGHEGSGLRRCPFGRYLIFYLEVEGHIEIARILNSAMNYEAILFPGN